MGNNWSLVGVVHLTYTGGSPHSKSAAATPNYQDNSKGHHPDVWIPYMTETPWWPRGNKGDCHRRRLIMSPSHPSLQERLACNCRYRWCPFGSRLIRPSAGCCFELVDSDLLELVGPDPLNQIGVKQDYRCNPEDVGSSERVLVRKECYISERHLWPGYTRLQRNKLSLRTPPVGKC